MTFQTINPTTEERVAEFDALEPEQIEASIAAASRCFADWHRTDWDRRRTRMNGVVEILRNRRDELAELITLEMGKPITQSRSEIDFCAAIAEYYADNTEAIIADRSVPADGVDAIVANEPIGVLLGVMPWNFPFYQVIRLAAPNLMVGNTVVIKHAENVPQCGEMVQQVFREAGFPDGAMTNMRVAVDDIAGVIADARVRGVSVTGSNRAGSAVAKRAGEHIKPVVLELGGNDPMIICDDVDLKEVVPMAVDARIVNSGQSCIAAKRFIVAAAVYDDFVEAMASQMSDVTLGDPMQESTQCGPLSSAGARSRLADQVERISQTSARVVTGGQTPSRAGFFFEPTVLADCQQEDDVADEEFFGPVAKVFRADDDDHAIRISNASRYGLGSSILCRDVDRARSIASRLNVGMAFINAPCKSRRELPFGGTKDSGFGRELGPAAALQFVNPKLIAVSENAS